MRIRAETQTAGYASKDMGGGGKLDKFTISAPGIITSVDSILAWSQTWGDCRRAKDKNGQKAASTMVTQECLALIKVLDKSGLGWKSVVPPEVKKHVEDVIGSGTQTMDPDLLGVLTSFMARDDQACQYQSSIVEEKKEKFTEFYNAVTKADKPAATKALADVTALNTTLAKANKEVGFKETDHLIPVDKMKILMSRPIWDVSSKPKRRAKEIDVNKHGLASYFTEFGFTKTGGLLSASISNTKNVTDASSGTWIVQKRREFEEPLALEYPGPAVEWITRSDAISICGKKRVDDAVLGYRAQLLDLRNTMQEWINECKTKGLDPDTGDPITDVRRLELRWLFPPATVGIAKDEGGRKRQPLADEVHHIKVGTGWSPPSQRRQEASREDRSSPGPRQRTYDSTPEASSSSGGRHLVRRGQK
ncbi:hypothetical protein LTS02_018117 [Friedmanniomyces endolithicus]|nr:hypothetical protein LTS02_018117 [Friedmanniomyces endolithicus]